MRERIKVRTIAFVGLTVVAVLLGGCGLLSRGEAPAPTPERVLVPTFTPTAEGQAAVEPEVAAPEVAEPEAAQQESVIEVPAAATEPPVAEAPAEETPTPEPPTPEPDPPTSTPVPKLIVEIDNANVRNGPGTNYGVAGAVSAGQAFDILGRNPVGDWLQFCCVNGQEGWIFAELVSMENGESVAVAENIPEPPVAAQPQPQPQEPAPQEPAPQEPAPQEPAEAPAPPPSGDPCAGIGGDGCKFRVRNGPLFGGNGGSEIKLQLLFVHSGIDGGQPQGSYFVVLMKDGVKLPILDGTRSIVLEKSQGALGAFNYEYKIGIGDIPGNTVAGNYVMYVLDGNGERDSQDFGFGIPDGQGEVWIEWDQG